ncbi:ABC transporter substrate-binding protein [Athalassotoga saccharophila]|uniref:ABC transporter substrate-binding protein n=1 Tax=Athalassotoga saccharophila TaxID=1441386 RepID=UPI00137A15DB|nr:ABC transporter substrate-binding protein [Athalassotoga saccharophila]BBJ28304.1 hypothetical protein ATHSA_1215 [Athalassotoga saccharophila]
MRKYLIISVIIIAIAVVAIVFFFEKNQKPVVGILFPVDSATSYSDRMAGVLIAIRSLPDEVKFVDIDFNSSDLSTVVSKSINSGIRYFVTFLTSSQASELRSVVNGKNVILVDSQVTNPFVINEIKNFYTISPTDTIQASAIANYIHAQNYKNVLIIKGDQNPIYENYLSSQIAKDLNNYGINSVIKEFDQNLDATADSVVLIMSSERVLNIMPRIRSKYGNVPVIGSDWTLDQTLLNSKKSNGMIATCFADLSDLPQSFKESLYKIKMFPDPSMLLAYNATIVVFILAKNDVGSNDAQKFLDSRVFVGSNGEFTFSNKSASSKVYFYKISGENLTLLWSWR